MLLWFVIIVLAGLCSWCLFRLAALRRGIDSLTQAIEEGDGVLDSAALPEVTKQAKLMHLGRVVSDVVTESTLQKSVSEGRRQILDIVLAQVADSLFVVDEDQLIRYSNAASHELFPNNKAFEGLHLIEVCFDHRISETVTAAMSSGERQSREIILPNTGRVVCVEAEPVDAGDDDRAWGGAWVMVTDRTAAMELEQTRKDFVANASHELKTPLSIIKGYLEMMDDEEESRVVSILQKHTDRLTRLVDDMLTISKLESRNDGQLLSTQEFNLVECANEVVEQLDLLIQKEGAQVKLDLPEEDQRYFTGDPFYFAQILFNLIENAIKHNPKTGLQIRVKIVNSPSDSDLLVEVSDNGFGIASGDLPYLFKRFYRAEKHHAKAKNEVAGTGLGLSIVKRAVESHGGTVEVASEPGIETKFTIQLPKNR
ncbi:MAG: ATP-binding protein [Verrucomicrobiota bacterium]